MAPIPEYPDSDPVELLPEIWTTVCHVVYTVTIVLESGIYRRLQCIATVSDGN
jgi:hypothetical protein